MGISFQLKPLPDGVVVGVVDEVEFDVDVWVSSLSFEPQATRPTQVTSTTITSSNDIILLNVFPPV
ncbi:MAG TPA: hypothetical protein VGA85_04895 [Dehalococcoidales bacterium]